MCGITHEENVLRGDTDTELRLGAFIRCRRRREMKAYLARMS
jgi:hypothetical protein